MQPDLLVVGGGPVGLALALALRGSGLDLVVADARSRDAVLQDPRVLALAHGTRLTLERLGIWEDLPATPIRSIHISQQGGFGRTELRADDYGLPALGYVVSAGALAGAFRSAVDRAGITVLDGAKITAIGAGPAEAFANFVVRGVDGVRDGRARLVACAEGGLASGEPDVVEHDYGQHALISRVEVEGGHGQRAFERFTPQGPVALLPCERHFAVVHVASTARSDALLALDDAHYVDALQQHFGSRVRLGAVADRQRFALSLRYRRDPVGVRAVWLGNAAQTLHPVAGQGFNLALRDVWALAETLLARGGDPGDAATLAAYRSARRLDRFGTIRFTDALVRVFSNDFWPLRELRGAALFALDVLPPLRDFVARRMMFGARAWP